MNTVSSTRLRIENITINFTDVVAVDNVSLIVEPGEFFTLLGPSGCGKTTLLRTIAGFCNQNEGHIYFNDRLVDSLPAHHRDTGMVFQNYAVFPHLTVWQNVEYGLKARRVPKQEMSDRVKEALRLVDLNGYEDRKPSQLSGGQQQRVVVARAAVVRPQILLMDEPLSNLDAKLRTEMRASLKRLHRDLDATTVYVTHDQIEALTLSDRVIIMNEGQIMQEGSPYDIYHHPTNIFVAEFIGDPGINLFEGDIENGKLNCGGISIPLPSNISNNNGRLTVGVRPEKIEVSESKKSGWQEVTTGIIQPTGANTIMEVKSEDTSITVLQNGFINLSENSKLWINFNSETLSFFDPKTQENLRNKMV